MTTITPVIAIDSYTTWWDSLPIVVRAQKDHEMSRRRCTPEQVIRKLAEGHKLLAHESPQALRQDGLW